MAASVISREELKKLIDSKGKYVLVDVRERAELAYGSIPTAHNIPFSEFRGAMEMDPEEFRKRYFFPRFLRNDNVIFYCRSGGRSEKAAKYAIAKGHINAKNFAGGILEWSEIDPSVKKYGPGV
ncbi:hypothetical protein HY638_02605 [Candidatus Woesearchaeota archaeon]|nr:hypothetical protein [Candidatus Woesearchaeota archaeon]